jgi:hypothetical protein
VLEQGVPCKEATVLEQTFEKSIAKVLLKQGHSKKIKLDLRRVMLLDSQSTTDLCFNKELVEGINKATTKLRLKGNGGTMTVSHKARIPGYRFEVWYSKNAIANILSLKNLGKQYHVMYDSRDKSFVVHREDENA